MVIRRPKEAVGQGPAIWNPQTGCRTGAPLRLPALRPRHPGHFQRSRSPCDLRLIAHPLAALDELGRSPHPSRSPTAFRISISTFCSTLRSPKGRHRSQDSLVGLFRTYSYNPVAGPFFCPSDSILLHPPTLHPPNLGPHSGSILAPSLFLSPSPRPDSQPAEPACDQRLVCPFSTPDRRLPSTSPPRQHCTCLEHNTWKSHLLLVIRYYIQTHASDDCIPPSPRASLSSRPISNYNISPSA